MRKRYGYAYLITFVRPTDGSVFYYVGQKLGQTPNKKYHGSGLRINNLVKKYGRKGNAKCNVLAWAYSQDELNFYETMFIHFAKLLYQRQCVNLVHGGANGKAAASTRKKQSIAAKQRGPRSRESIEKQRAKLIGRSQSEEHIAKRIKAHIGAKRSEESRQRMREAALRKPPDSDETRRRKSLGHLGIKMSAESSARKSASLKGRVHETVRCPHCKMQGAKPGMVRWHFDNCTRL